MVANAAPSRASRTAVPVSVTTSCAGWDDCIMAGRVEAAVRDSISPGDRLVTPSGRGQFTVARYPDDGLVLLLGEKEAWTPLPWKALDEVPGLLRGRGWVPIGGAYSVDSVPGTLDEHLKKFLRRATATGSAVRVSRHGRAQIIGLCTARAVACADMPAAALVPAVKL